MYGMVEWDVGWKAKRYKGKKLRIEAGSSALRVKTLLETEIFVPMLALIPSALYPLSLH